MAENEGMEEKDFAKEEQVKAKFEEIIMQIINEMEKEEATINIEGTDININVKREKDIYVKIIDEENIAKAIDAVSKTHRWNYGHKPNRTVLWVESTKPDRIVEIRDIIEHGFIPSNPRRRRIFDQAAWKWRDICQPRLYPDQYIHHAVIQALTPIMMK